MGYQDHHSSPAGAVTGKESLHRLARNGMLSLASTLLNAAFTVVVVIVLARTLGKEALGRYYSVYVAIVVVQLMLEAGLSTVLTRRIAHSPHLLSQIVAEAKSLFLIVGTASWAVLSGLGLIWAIAAGDPAPLRFGLLAGFSCWAMQSEQWTAGVFRGIERFDLEAAAKVLQGLALALLVVAFPPRGALGVEVAVGLFMASHLIAAGFCLALLRRQLPDVGITWNRAVMRDWLAEAVPLGLGDILRRLTFQINHILLALMQPPAALGVYSVAYRPLGPLSLVPRAIVSATFPYFARIADHDRDAMQRAFTVNTRLLWVLSLPLAITIGALAEPIIRLVAGPAFMDAVLPMRLLAFVLVLSYPSTQFRFALTACGQQTLFTWMVLAGLVFETVLEAILIPNYGYMGACSGFLIGEIGFTLLGLMVCERLGLGAVPWRPVLAATPAAAVMAGGLLLAWQQHYIVQFLLAGVLTVVYFGVCLLCGAIRRSELRLLTSAVLRPLARKWQKAQSIKPAVQSIPPEADLAAAIRE